MREEHRMSIDFKEALEPDDFEGFEIDPLGELSPFERGVHQFAHDHDRHIRFRVGNDSTVVEAFRDVIPIFFDLSGGVVDLAAGNSFSLELPELGQSIGFSVAADGTVRCELRGFNTGAAKEYFLAKENTIGAFVGFMSEFLRQAVSAGCVLESDAATFLAPLSSLTKSSS